MDILQDGPLEFLDFTGIEESQKKWLQSCLYSTTSTLPLPWIITQNVPSLQSKAKHSQNEKKVNGPVTSNHVKTEQGPPTGFVTHPYDQGQYASVYPITSNLTPKFPVSPGPYTMAYPAAVVPMPPIYTSFHHAPPQGMRSSPSTIINPVIYSPEPSYTFPQVSAVPASYNALPPFAHGTQYGANVPNTISPQPEPNGTSSTIIQERILPVASLSPQPVFIHNPILPAPNPTHVTTSTSPPIQINSPDASVNSESCQSNPQKISQVEKPVHPPTVSYGVPNSSPFPANKDFTNSVVNASPAVNKTDNDKTSANDVKLEQNGVTTNGHSCVDTISSMNKSWASLFNKEPSSSVSNSAGNISNSMAQGTNKDMDNNSMSNPISHPKKTQFVDPAYYRMGEFLISHNVDGRTISLQPRGLINRNNYCYINSILQALLACPPLYNLLSGLSKNVTNSEKRKPTPVIDSMCKLVNEFEHLPAGQRVGRRTEKNQKKEAGVSINCGNPFEPSWIYKMLNGMRSDSFLIEGRQEDAEEFFGCLLNGLNDEIQELMKLVVNEEVKSPTEADKESEDWQVMGPKNKGSITRKTIFGKTPISNIFGGLLRSKIHRTGDESTNNIQPFFTLQLNIEKVKTVSEALEALSSKNQLEGVTSPKTNEQVEAWQQVMIEELPIVLVLHLKCFDYQLNGCTKIMKALEFPIDLKIDAKLLSSKMNSSKEKQYKLFAVVYHDGKEASKGHYLTDAFHVGYNSWLRYDDASIKAVSEEQVLSPQGCRVPYLLFYRRSDTIRSK